MTPEQVEVLKRGYEIYTFRIEVKSDPPYGVNGTVAKCRVQGITRGRGMYRIHAVPFDSDPADPPASIAYTPGEVYTSATNAAKGCLECVDGIIAGIGDLKQQIRELAKKEKAELSGGISGRKRRKKTGDDAAGSTTDGAAPATDGAAPAEADATGGTVANADAAGTLSGTAVESEPVAPIGTDDLPGEKAWIGAEPEDKASKKRGRNGRKNAEPVAEPPVDTQEAPVAAEDETQEVAAVAS